MIEGKVFITGGAGFLGKGIIRRALSEKWPCDITVFSRDEVKHSIAKREFPSVNFVRGDVSNDLEQLKNAISGHDIVIHAAATKIIPVAEYNVIKTIYDNIIGTINVAYACAEAGVKKALLTSTDKTAHSINTYGASKFLGERVFQEAQTWGYATDYYITRYGNVLDSTASVLGIWSQQYQNEGEIGITDPEMTRFWLTVDQAVDLILLALRQDPGTITIPMLPALSMYHMADYLFPEAGQKVIGLRPGEKIHEELLTAEERHRAIVDDDNRVFVLYPSGYVLEDENDTHNTGYQSNNPIRWIDKHELYQMVGWVE
jgi:UDP-N-acetylglucosamine 4,6-dehydratase